MGGRSTWKAESWKRVTRSSSPPAVNGFEVLEDLEMIEVKQGPYAGDHDKTRLRRSIRSS